jgi:hypothetical protein
VCGDRRGSAASCGCGAGEWRFAGIIPSWNTEYLLARVRSTDNTEMAAAGGQSGAEGALALSYYCALNIEHCTLNLLPPGLPTY